MKQLGGKNTITSFQLIFLIPGIQVGVGILSLYRTVFEAGAGPDAWISIIIVGFLAQTAIFLMIHLASCFPEDSLIDYVNKLLGKFLGKLFSAGIMLYFIITSASIANVFAFVLRIWALRETPFFILVLFSLVPASYIIANGVKVLARFSFIVFALTWWIILILIVPITQGDILNILPVGQSGLYGIIKGTLGASFALVGLEFLLLLYPFVDRKKDVLIAASVGNWLTIAAYALTVIASTIFFSPMDIVKQIWPSLQMLKILQFTFFQRFEVLVLSFWLLLVIVTVAAYQWGAAYTLHKLLNLKSFQISVLSIGGIIYIVSTILIKDLNQVLSILDSLGFVGIALISIIPFMLLIIYYLKKWRSKKHDK
ncbi:MAG: hypothetical protein APF76_08985 [Desulfitibacter sp. BRH_c19]|nr:MAG: hypothetical protein APF76_08985 [Desulfitibacter sp. BRH_c19]